MQFHDERVTSVAFSPDGGTLAVGCADGVLRVFAKDGSAPLRLQAFAESQGWIGSRSHVFLSRVNPDVYLAELMISQPELREDEENLDIQAFLESGETFEQLVDQAAVIRTKFRKGSMAMGGFVGLALGITLMNQVVFRRKEDYEPHKGDCFSCGRCMDYCPVGKEDHPYFLEEKSV